MSLRPPNFPSQRICTPPHTHTHVHAATISRWPSSLSLSLFVLSLCEEVCQDDGSGALGRRVTRCVRVGFGVRVCVLDCCCSAVFATQALRLPEISHNYTHGVHVCISVGDVPSFLSGGWARIFLLLFGSLKYLGSGFPPLPCCEPTCSPAQVDETTRRKLFQADRICTHRGQERRADRPRFFFVLFVSNARTPLTNGVAATFLPSRTHK